jgi:type IV pilus assembly protein PilY1
MRKELSIGIIVFILLLLVSAASSVFAAAMGNYCQSPPFISAVVPPNVLLLVDVSTSMGYPAYSQDKNGNPVSYNSSTSYEGYFDPTKDYALNAGDSTYYEHVASGLPCTRVCDTWSCKTFNTGSCDPKGTHGCNSNKYACCTHYTTSGDCTTLTSGNRLNFDNMARIDLVRWAMTGGTPESCTGSNKTSNYCDPRVWNVSGNDTKVGSACKNSLDVNEDGTPDGGCILLTDNGKKVAVPWSRVNAGLLFQFQNIKPRMGAMFFAGTGVKSNYVYVGDFTSANSRTAYPYQNLLTEMNATDLGVYTPTGPAFWDAYHYLSQTDPEYGGIPPQAGSGDKWKNPMYDCPDQGGANCIYIPCVKNFVMVMSDGLWNIGGPPTATSTCSIDTGYENHSADPVVPAYKMHMGFTNAATSVATKVSGVYTLGIFVGGDGERALKNIAIYGSFNNSSKTWPDSKTDYPKTTCSITDNGAVCPSNTGKGSSCTSLPTSSVDWDKNADGVPDTYYSADNALTIKNKIMDAILDMLTRVSSGTAASILASGEGSGANLVQAVFYPKKAFEDTDISWVGEMQNLWYYLDPWLQSSTIREDTVTDKELNLQNDYIVHFRFDSSVSKTKADRYNNAGTYQNTVDLEEVKNLWEAGKILWHRDLSTSPRTLYTSINGTSFSNFSPASAETLQSYLQAGDVTEATNIINYIRGIDQAGYRNRTVTIPAVDSTPRVWKLGDIISSTPKLQSWVALNSYHTAAPYGYGDNTYQKFIKSENYKTRGTAYVGSNDGMLHAFKLGMLEMINDPSNPNRISKLCDDGNSNGKCDTDETSIVNLGKEEWAFIPKNALPYLRYFTDPDYCHLYYVDASTYLLDASIVKPSDCTETNDWDCEKKTVVDSSNNLDSTKTSWRTILIGGMGLGGACRKTGDSCTDCVKTPILDPADNTKGLGYSSYFAIDITDPQNPSLLWEFSDSALGFSTTGPVIVRTGDKNKNGRWFAVFASGPTGPIDTSAQQFYSKSDQYLRIFILDLKTGNLLRTITMDGTGDNPNIPNAFGGSLINTTIDTDGWKPERTGNYQDDVFYVGYVKKCTSTTSVCTSGTWTNGGVLRVVTQVDNPETLENESLNPNNWKVSTLIDNIGPVTSSIAHLQARKNHRLWLYLGTGRYFYKIGTDIDDADSQRAIFGIKEPCYNASDQFDSTCTSSVSGLTDATTTPPSTEPENGWYINLDSSGTTYKAERVITNPLAATAGAVFFTTFAPTADVCGFGGNTYLWAVKYSTGGGPPSSALRGTAIVQVSTGEIKELPLSSAFTEKSGRRTIGFTGMPPTAQGLSLISPPLPVKRVLHIRER